MTTKWLCGVAAEACLTREEGHAGWGPGIICGRVRGNYLVSMPGSVVKCTPQQLRMRTQEERAADRVLTADLRASLANLSGDGSGFQRGFMDITSKDVPDDVGPTDFPAPEQEPATRQEAPPEDTRSEPATGDAEVPRQEAAQTPASPAAKVPSVA